MTEKVWLTEMSIPQFNTKKPLSSTHPSVQHTPQFNTPLSSTQAFLGLNYEVRWTWGCVEPRGVLNWGVFGVKLRDFGGWKKVALSCWTDVLNWGGPAEIKKILSFDIFSTIDILSRLFF